MTLSAILFTKISPFIKYDIEFLRSSKVLFLEGLPFWIGKYLQVKIV
jgi:hypothetical protein